MKQNCMTGFMISCDLLFFFGNDFAAFLGSDTNLDKGMLDIRLCDITPSGSFAAMIAASFRRFSRSAPVNPAVVCAICARFTSSPSGLSLAWTLRISSLPFTSGLPTATLRSKRPGRRIAGSRISTRLVAAITMIPSLTPKSIHLYQKLVQGLLSLIMTAAHTGTTLSCNCIDLIDKNDTWCMLLAFFKKVSAHGMHRHRQTFPQNQIRKWRRTELPLLLQLLWQEVSYRFREGLQGSLPSGFSHLHLVYFCGAFRKSTTSYQIFLFFLKTCNILEGDFLVIRNGSFWPGFYRNSSSWHCPPPPDIWRFIIRKRKITSAPVRSTGRSVVINTLSCGTSAISG